PFDDTPVGRIGMLTVKALPTVAVAADSPAARAGVVFGDTVLSIDGVDVATRDDFFAALDAKPASAPFTLVVERRADIKDQPGVRGVASRHTIHVGAAAIAEPAAPGALTFAVTSDEVTGAVATAVAATADVVRAATVQQQQRRGLASIDGVVGAIEPDSPAASRNLVVHGHRVVAVDGKPLQFANDLPTALKKDVDGIHVLGLVDGAGVGSTFALRLQPSARREAAGQKIVGITLSAANGGAATTTREVGLVEGVQRAVLGTGETIRGVALGYVMLFTGQVGLDQLGGPVMLANIAGEAARSGLDVFLGTMAVISVNLALLNLLPVPVLDGGHILLFAIEAIRRRRLSVEARIRATTIGLVFVGGLTVIALLNDVLSIFR
ncbi:MAG TPA: site-2 protease family protein, partial [Myxococcota bacterium]